ncbi:homeobox protein cut-like 2 isoform X2 [Asterias rubens]|uniref:homeobox protein cut-like 2 isoform X2 n=1 Tax=Asterias rubens TaxID=7604 RepID=UPI001454FB50|nr:homeobox protein cut-like 2 isoform X2 [Asterias rubens]
MAAANVSSMFQYWKNFDLPLLQRELDTTATELASRQDESDSSRKKLVEQSREFKKNTPEDIRKSVSPLLKLFQSEIDALSKRSKAAEASFLSVYKKLIDLPDPVPVLEHSLSMQKRAQKALDLEVENQKLRETLDEYNQEFAEVKNQEVTIKNLREKLRDYEERLETTAQSRAKEKEKELQREFIEKERQLQETQLNVATKLGEAELKIQTLQTALDASQSELFDLRAKFDEQSAAKSDEVDMLMTDLERTNQRNAVSEKELETVRTQLASATQALQQAEQMQKAPSVAIDILTRSSLEVELSAKEKEISQLVEDVQRLQAANAKLRDSSANQIQKLEEQLGLKTAALQKLEEQSRSRGDYDEIKRELSVLKSIEFNAQGSDMSESGDPNDGTATPKSLEMLLLEKNRTLQSENTTLKVTKADVNSPGGISQAQAFASLIGQEVAAAYSQQVLYAQQQSQSGSQIIQPIIVIPPSFSNSSSSPLQHLHMLQQQQQQQQHAQQSQSTPSRPRTPKSEQVNPAVSNHEWLDTVQIARRVKEVLTEHNIGQRIFGEHVLGLSQGSVSDILSRTKTWDKLTLKGREPFIKMVQFLSDRQYVEQLKILSSHKKGKEMISTVPPNGVASNSAVTHSGSDTTPAPMLKTSTEEAINNILALAKQEMESKNVVPGMVRPGDRRCDNPNIHTHSTHRQKTPPAHSWPSNGGSPSRHNGQNIKLERSKSSSCAVTPSNQQVEESYTNGVSSESADEGSSSRDEMNDIKSSFMSINPRMPRRIMAPLTVQQYEINKELDTLEIARQVRERLAKGNIPQRVFGYHVIGLSQGSVSDILSKPKRWDKLTVKGREPFIRMKLWLEDPDGLISLKEAVRKASGFWMEQQRPSPAGTDNSDQHSASEMSPGPPTPTPSQTHPDRTPTPTPAYLTQEPASPLNLSSSSSAPNRPSAPNTPVHCSTPSAPSTPPITHTTSTPTHMELQTPSPPQHFPELPPVHEQAAMIEFLDTFELTRQVKAILQQQGVGQKAFGEAVLGLTQGSVSDLLSKPKMWLKLSMKGREPYIRMYLWLQDKDGVEKVKSYRPVRRPKRFSFVDPREVSLVGTPMKKPRVLLSPEEKEALLASYNSEPYPSQSAIELIASDLKLPVSTVINWFHNHRSRLKRGHSLVEDASNFMIQTADGNIIGPDGMTATHAMIYNTDMTEPNESTSTPPGPDDSQMSTESSPKAINGNVMVEMADERLIEASSLEPIQTTPNSEEKLALPSQLDDPPQPSERCTETGHQATSPKPSTDRKNVTNGVSTPPRHHKESRASRQSKKAARREQLGIMRGMIGIPQDQVVVKDAYSILERLESGVRDGSGDEWEF